MFMTPKEALALKAKTHGFLPVPPYNLSRPHHPHCCLHCGVPKFKVETSKPKLCCSGDRCIGRPHTRLPDADEAFLNVPRVVRNLWRFNSAIAPAPGLGRLQARRRPWNRLPGAGVGHLPAQRGGLVFIRIAPHLTLGTGHTQSSPAREQDCKTAANRFQQILQQHNPAP